MKTGLPEEKASAAWKWIKFYAGPEAALIRIKYTDTVPSFKLDLTNEKMDLLVHFYPCGRQNYFILVILK